MNCPQKRDDPPVGGGSSAHSNTTGTQQATPKNLRLQPFPHAFEIRRAAHLHAALTAAADWTSAAHWWQEMGFPAEADFAEELRDEAQHLSHLGERGEVSTWRWGAR